MLVWLGVAAAADFTVRVPFPTTRMYEAPDRVCLNVGDAREIEPMEVDDGRFLATCESRGGFMELCLTLTQDTWPERVAPLECEGREVTVRLKPVRAFDPSEDIWDGVRIARSATVLQATFRADGVPDAPGILDGGGCGVTDGQFWIKTRSRVRNQSCLLVLPEGERRIPVVLVDRIAR